MEFVALDVQERATLWARVRVAALSYVGYLTDAVIDLETGEMDDLRGAGEEPAAESLELGRIIKAISVAEDYTDEVQESVDDLVALVRQCERTEGIEGKTEAGMGFLRFAVMALLDPRVLDPA